jgi:hypothetical protein
MGNGTSAWPTRSIERFRAPQSKIYRAGKGAQTEFLGTSAAAARFARTAAYLESSASLGTGECGKSPLR